MTAAALAPWAGPYGPAADWPEPAPIADTLPEVAPMVEALLPDALRPLCLDVFERMQVPLDFPAVASVLCLAGAVNRRAAIQPKALDGGWVVVPNLWGGIVAPPGLLKSPVLAAITAPLLRIGELWRAEHLGEMQSHAEAAEEAELRLAAWREQYKAAQKGGKSAPPRPDTSVPAPTELRLICNDATFEALHQIMASNPAGVLVLRDELTGWLAQLDRPGREGERAFCLEAWNGDGAHTIDRIGRGSVHVPHCCMSLLGGIQPARLRVYLADALRDGPANDGLMQRFQVLAFPDAPRHWRYVDRAPDSAAACAAERMYERLAAMDADAPAQFRFAPDAQELFVAWLGELEPRLRSGEMHPAMVAHLAKYRSLMPSLALLFALADGESEVVPLRHAQQAATWCDYLESHARRVYASAVLPAVLAAVELAQRLAGGWRRAEGDFRTRDVYRSGWTGLTTPEAARAALMVLDDHGWVRRLPGEPGPDGGRPTQVWAINPRIRGAR